MTQSPVPIKSFGGLDLVADPEELGWNGAIDCLNVDFDRHGRIRTRDGLTDVNSVALGSGAFTLFAWPGKSRLLVNSSTNFYAYNSSTGAQVTSVAASTVQGVAALGTGAAGPYLYYCQGYGTAVKRFDGTTFTAPGGMPNAEYLAVQGPDNRLVAGSTAAGELSRIKFSDAGAPETWGANNWVDLHPNDGQALAGLVAWENKILAFKGTKYFVFGGNTTDPTGNPIFNYYTVDTGIGAGPAAGTSNGGTRYACAAPDGVYFSNNNGIYRTTGGPPQKVSGPIEPWFRGGLSAFSTLTGMATEQPPYHLTAIRGRIFATFTDGASTQGTAFVYDPDLDRWMVWSFADAVSSATRPMFAELTSGVYAITGTTHIQQFGSSATTDSGTAIASRYRAGFSDLGHADKLRKVIRQWNLRGSGTVTFGVAADDATSIPSSGGGAQTSVSLTGSRPNYRKAQRGQNFSWQASATSGAWRLDEAVAEVS